MNPHSASSSTLDLNLARQRLSFPAIPFDVLHSIIIAELVPEIILEYLHSVLVVGEDLSWNAFTTLPLVSHDFNRTCRTYYRMIFGFRNEDYTSDQVQAIYARARNSWSRARGRVIDSEDDLIVRYRELMANESLIQVYICLAYSRRFMNLDVLSPLFHRRRSMFLPDILKPVELILGSSSYQGHDDESEDKDENIDARLIQDNKMHRLFMPLTCVMKLCDRVSPPWLTRRIAQFTAEIAPYCTTIPVLLKYAQDLESHLTQGYPISSDVQADWVLQSLNLIIGIDTFFEQFIESGHVVCSSQGFHRVPKRVYEIVDLPRLLAQIVETEWGKNSERICDTVHGLITKIDNLS